MIGLRRTSEEPSFLGKAGSQRPYESTLLKNSAPFRRQEVLTWIGFDPGPGPALSKVDTSVLGNRNTGHEFANRAGKGVLGPALSQADRMALIEFIKTL